MSEEGIGGIFTAIIVTVASLFEALGIQHENAIKYAKILVYGGIAVIIIIFVGWIIRIFRGK